jgi:hypothetical protein
VDQLGVDLTASAGKVFNIVRASLYFRDAIVIGSPEVGNLENFLWLYEYCAVCSKCEGCSIS